MISLTDPQPQFDFYDEERPVYTHARFLPGARMDRCEVTESIVCDAARMLKARIHKSIIGVRARVRRNAVLDRVVLMGADYMEDDVELSGRENPDVPFLGIGENTVIEDAIIDKNARIGRNVRMLRKGRIQEVDNENYSIRDGVLIVPKNGVIPDNTVIGAE